MSFQRENSDMEIDMSAANNHPSNINGLDYNRLNYEEERLKSFASWPVHYPVNPARLAKAGFYYTGIRDDVVCFSCRGHISDWNFGDIVLKKHSERSPDCDFIRNVSNNIPLSRSQPSDIENCSDVTPLDGDINFEKLKSEIERMETYIDKWPLININVSDLAHAGYFYTGIGDKVQCAFCKVIVGNFNASNMLNRECLKHFPWCDYLDKKSKGKNIKPWYHASSQDVCGNMKPIESHSSNASPVRKLITSNLQQVDLEELGVCLHKNPVHPQFMYVWQRLETFSSWPIDAPISKEDLAAAGFFYLGMEDRTVCFHCNGGLQKWEKGDDPWVEHARWFSGCEFLRLNKGSDFTVDCLLKSTLTFLDEEKEVVLSGPESSESILKKLDGAMRSNIVRNLIEAGMFPSYILRAAILLQIKYTGSNFPSYDDLCMASSYLKEKMEQQYSNEKSVNPEDLNICLQIAKCLTISETTEKQNKMQQQSRIYSYKGETGAESSEMDDIYLCKICMEKQLGVVFLPCGHLPACTTCASLISICPMCRKPIQATVRCFFQ